MNYLDELHEIKTFIKNHEYPLQIELYKQNKVRLMDLILFQKEFKNKREFFLNDDQDYINNYLNLLLNMSAIHDYEGNQKTKLVGISHEQDTYQFYFSKKRLSKKVHVITIRKKTNTFSQYELLTGEEETTYPEKVAFEFLKQNIRNHKGFDIEENTDIIQLIDTLEAEKKYCLDYDANNSGFSSIATAKLSDTCSHYIQMNNGQIHIYSDKKEHNKSSIQDYIEGVDVKFNGTENIYKEYLEKQIVTLSDFNDKDLENAIKNYMITTICLRSKEDDGMENYEYFLKVMKENKGIFAGYALNEMMHRGIRQKPNLQRNIQLYENIEILRWANQVHDNLEKYVKNCPIEEKKKIKKLLEKIKKLLQKNKKMIASTPEADEISAILIAEIKNQMQESDAIEDNIVEVKKSMK